MTRSIMITGARGFTGQHLVTALRQRGETVIPVVGPQGARPGDHVCDLTDRSAVKHLIERVRPTHVIHLAAVSFVAHADVQAFYRVNVLGTTHLLDALAAQPPEDRPVKVLLASSANIYGEPAVDLIDEQVCPSPVNHYACSKLAMEHMARTYAERLPVILVRPFNYTGPGQHERFLVPKIVHHFQRREPVIELGNLDVSRDFSDVRDVIQAYLALLDVDAAGVTCNLCSGQATALRDIIETMNRLAGYTIEVRVNPDFVRRNEIPRLVGDPARMHQLTGVVVRPFKETLSHFYHATEAT
ncbi:NAD-dependent epimerase/dehydratase family protein [Ectothiorhodospira variabilis]|uniref:NAD-dependent epimerase/dehydratase family protein n=1 Tax=Ectothiorhodospira variabilis TaxID=505694 RepID=UPI001EFAA504|nr:GDP-mannose 4,6-dehydratase [Ectothiorhodospira variabilis]MCG5495699.1 GDP-mannose 4,6-dehydratase [Ectothiorhodospira variabilis]MCG5504595.1 GDP-mannose 4,6-dehydratase [Ectothiorhodospira variabilis]MCG5507697.1 GDP-mannose 4,6-dehydratase [Ectothiorhodospira variabilis]